MASGEIPSSDGFREMEHIFLATDCNSLFAGQPIQIILRIEQQSPQIPLGTTKAIKQFSRTSDMIDRKSHKVCRFLRPSRPARQSTIPGVYQGSLPLQDREAHTENTETAL